MKDSVSWVTSDSGPSGGSRRPGSSGSIVSMSSVSRLSGPKARRIRIRLAASMIASPPARAYTRPLAGSTISTMHAASRTAAFGTNNRQKSGM